MKTFSLFLSFLFVASAKANETEKFWTCTKAVMATFEKNGTDFSKKRYLSVKSFEPNPPDSLVHVLGAETPYVVVVNRSGTIVGKQRVGGQIVNSTVVSPHPEAEFFKQNKVINQSILTQHISDAIQETLGKWSSEPQKDNSKRNRALADCKRVTGPISGAAKTAERAAQRGQTPPNTGVKAG